MAQSGFAEYANSLADGLSEEEGSESEESNGDELRAMMTPIKTNFGPGKKVKFGQEKFKSIFGEKTG